MKKEFSQRKKKEGKHTDQNILLQQFISIMKSACIILQYDTAHF